MVRLTFSDIPVYNEDVKAAAFPDAVVRLQHAITSADAVLIATPEYNYSVSGVLKNAIDWVSRTDPQPFANKPVAIMGASPGALGTARAQYDLRRMFVYLDAHLLNKPEVMISAAHTHFDADGRLTDQATRKFVASPLATLSYRRPHHGSRLAALHNACQVRRRLLRALQVQRPAPCGLPRASAPDPVAVSGFGCSGDGQFPAYQATLLPQPSMAGPHRHRARGSRLVVRARRNCVGHR